MTARISRVAVLCASLGSLAFAGRSQAAVFLSQYTFTGTSLSANNVDPNVTSSDVSFNVSAQASMPNFLEITPNGNATTEAAAVSANAYYTFTVAPKNFITMKLTSIAVDDAQAYSGGVGWALRSSVDGFASDLGSHTSGLTTSPTTATQTVNLSGTFLTGLTSQVTFRVYSFGSAPSTPTTVFDNLTVNGSTPEPVALPALGGIAFLCRRRARTLGAIA